jgi:hypothetical protein
MSLVSGVELVMSSSIISRIAGRHMGATAPRISGYGALAESIRNCSGRKKRIPPGRRLTARLRPAFGAAQGDRVQVPPPIASPVDSGRRCNRRPHPATASEESCGRRGHGLVSLTDPSRPPTVHCSRREILILRRAKINSHPLQRVTHRASNTTRPVCR